MTQEHELVPSIREWLRASSDADIPTGIERAAASREAEVLLSGVTSFTAPADYQGLRDVLWAAVELLEAKPACPATFEECDDSYRFVASLPRSPDPFDEVDEILRRIARVGWISTNGGLESVLRARSAIWEHGDEKRHRDLCESAQALPIAVEALISAERPDLPTLYDVAATLIKLTNVRPALARSMSGRLAPVLWGKAGRIGHLDDQEHFRATFALVSGMASRQLSDWSASSSSYAVALSNYAMTVNAYDLERVEVERLALAATRADDAAVVLESPALIQRARIPRERAKAELIRAHSLINQRRTLEAEEVLRRTLRRPVIQEEPNLHAWLLGMLGMSLSYQGRDVEAMDSFDRAGQILTRYRYPLQIGTLVGAIGEHLGKLGRYDEAASLFERSRDVYCELDQAHQVAYINVLRAEMLVLLGKNQEAKTELLATFPIIERLNLKREAVAAMAILREALANRQADAGSIRRLRDQLRGGKG